MKRDPRSLQTVRGEELAFSSRVECSVSQVGDTMGMKFWNDTPGTYPDIGEYHWQLGPPEMRFYWTAHATNAIINWFRCSSSQCGVDPHCLVTLPVDLDCLLNRWKPAHTAIVYDYSNLEDADSMTGTP